MDLSNKPIHPTKNPIRLAESDIIPYFKKVIEESGYKLEKTDGSNVLLDDWKFIFRSATDSIVHFLEKGYSVNLYKFGTFRWTYLGVREIEQAGVKRKYPARFALRFKPGVTLNNVVKEVTDRYI